MLFRTAGRPPSGPAGHLPPQTGEGEETHAFPRLRGKVARSAGRGSAAVRTRRAMLSSTAKNLYWMGRYLQRAKTTARLIEATQRMALQSSGEEAEGVVAIFG